MARGVGVPREERDPDASSTGSPVASGLFSRELSRRRPTLELSLARSLSKQGWTVPDNVFARESDARDDQDGPGDDEQALTWAAIQRLPTYNRLRTTVLALPSKSGRRTLLQQVDVTKLGFQERQRLIDKLLAVAHDDNEAFLKKLRARFDKVGVKVPTVEVRYHDLSVEGDTFVGDRNLPTLFNTARTILESALPAVGIPITRKVVHPILKDVSGIVEPGRMTLLLGPPASGKTTLLLALAGRLSSDLRVKGKVTYNGKGFTQFVPQKTAAYIGQTDLHSPEMTVRETLDFSAWCQGVGTRYEMLSELIRREKEAGILPEADIDLYMKATAIEGVKSSLVTDYTLKILELDICADIMVGDNMRRGISGGQRKRVTTGEMIVGPTKTLFMDEISNGLDSSTTFHIVRNLRQFVHVLDSTMVISLLQPAPETYSLFDDIILLSEGQIVYHGPCEHILPFFEECGFRCPERKGTADFLQEVMSKNDQYQYWYDEQRPYQYVTLTDFANKFKEFHVGKQLAARLGTNFDNADSHPAALASDKYSISKLGLLKANWEREWLLMKRNVLVYRIKATQLGIAAVFTGTVFWRSRLHYDNAEDGQIYSLALFYGLVVIMFNGFPELNLTIQRLPVFFKQRELQLYPGWAYAIPAILLKIPISFLESFIFTAISYFLVGFAPEASRFVRQFLIFFLEHLTAGAMFRTIAALSRSMVVASTAGSGALLIALVCGGFVIPRPNIPHWWIWAYWASPLSYVQMALSVNEMRASRWMSRFVTTEGGEMKSLGVYLLESHGFFSQERWYWISVGALMGFIIFLNVVYIFALTYLNPINNPQAIISKDERAKTELSSKHENAAGKLSGRDVEMVASKSASSNNGNTVVEAAAIASKNGMILPFIPLGLSFDNVGYSVDMPAEMKAQGIEQDRLELLRNVSGAFRPGVLTALVGVSGAGKTTLMDVLAGRKTGGYVKGDIRISGFPKKQETFARISGYCEQNDIHSPQVTVHESLLFSAWLRLSHDVPQDTKMVFVEEVMELVELTPLQNALVGLPGVSGLSTEQRKRLTIAVELVANPSIIFMDEPTSGLDARAAAIVMRAVRNTVDTARTVVCTIHQPSIDIFESFDELMLLKLGGQVIYAGPLGRHSDKLIEYFEAIPGVPKMEGGVNPSTWMLEISSTASESRLGVDFAEIYAKSELHQQNKALIKELSVPAEGAQDLHFPTEHSQPFLVQLHACLWKQMWSYWRSPGYNLVRFSFTTFASLVLGSLFWRAGRSIETQQDLYNVMGSMHGGTMFMGINNCMSVQPAVSAERTVFYRERGAGLYSPWAYALSQVIIEIPYVLFQTVVHVLIVYALIGYEWDPAKFFWYFYIAFCSFLHFTLYGMTAVAVTPNLQLSNILSSAFFFIFNLFSGFIIPRPRIPPWWIWAYWICPVGWTVAGLLTSQYADVESKITLVGGEQQSVTVKEFMKSNFGFTTSLLPAVGVAMIVFPFLFAILFMLCSQKLNFQRR